VPAFGPVAYTYDISRGIRDGFLSPIHIRTCALEIDLSNVTVQGGDFQASSLGDTLDPYLEAVADEIAAKASDRKILVFTPLVKTGEKFARILQEKGIRTENICGVSEDRQELLEKFHTGEIQALTNSMLLTEGFDEPAVDCIVNLRATKSRALYEQIMGRGTRISPDTGKENLLVLDFMWQSKKAGFDILSPVDVLLPQEDNSFAREILRNADEEVSMDDLADGARQNRLDAEAKLLAHLKAITNRHFRSVTFNEVDRKNVFYTYDENDDLDCVQVRSEALDALKMFDRNVDHFYPVYEWQCTPPTEDQCETLKNNGIDPEDIPFNGFAVQVIAAVENRQERGFCSYKQAKFLKRNGFKNTMLWSRADASKMIDTVVKNHYRPPYWLRPKTYVPDSVRQLMAYAKQQKAAAQEQQEEYGPER
jgi:hypothetical protein